MKKRIYADYAAATPTDPQVISAMLPYFGDAFGNPSSSHSFGQRAHQALEAARSKVATFLNCQPSELYFTGSGTEANNLALLGIARANKNKGKHIITTQIEHPSILNACGALEKDGYSVTYLPVNAAGLVETDSLKKALTAQTILVSVHLANSEIGVIQDVAALAKLAHTADAFFHTDACQASAYLDLNLRDLGVDALSINGSKMYGPKGVGALYVRSHVSIFPLVYGGGQERSLRSGTENIPGIVGLAQATEQTAARRAQESTWLTDLRDDLQEQLEKNGCQINIKNSNRLPNHLSVLIPWLKNADAVKLLDEKGIAISAGSACSSKSLIESHVLMAIGLTSQQANSTIRISLGRQTTAEDIKTISRAIKIAPNSRS